MKNIAISFIPLNHPSFNYSYVRQAFKVVRIEESPEKIVEYAKKDTPAAIFVEEITDIMLSNISEHNMNICKNFNDLAIVYVPGKYLENDIFCAKAVVYFCS